MSWENEDHINTGEKMLWVSVLRRAMFDYVQYKGKGKFEMKWKRANCFIFGGEKDGDVSFDEICAMFGWDPDYIRRVINKLSREDIKVLEPSRFKDEYSQYYADPVTNEPSIKRWTGSETSVPLFHWLFYSRDYRKRLIPRPVPVFISRITIPLVCWH